MINKNTYYLLLQFSGLSFPMNKRFYCLLIADKLRLKPRCWRGKVMLIIALIERLGIIVTVAFIMTRIPFFRKLIDQQSTLNRFQRIGVVLLFGMFGIIGTYTGLIIHPDSEQFSRWQLSLDHHEAIANSRVIGVVIAGLLGGWKMGIGSGLIAGIHRFTLGGFTAFACSISTIIAGVISGIFHKNTREKRFFSLKVALIVAMLAETVQMIIILLVSKPYAQALALVKEIGIPMIVANGVGTVIFLLIIKSVIQEEERAGAAQSKLALKIADDTLKHMRKGLNEESAYEVCHILADKVHAEAVSMTDTKRILAHIGKASDHHKKEEPIQTDATKYVIQTGELFIVGKEEINCGKQDCPLQSAIIAPLKQKKKVVGTLKFYFQSRNEISQIEVELVRGLSMLLSNQLEFAEIDYHRELANQAEIKMLQAQVSPHFLFNALNTIVSLIRTNPTKARKLLISLSTFFRKNLTGTTKDYVSLKEELNHVTAYLEIEEARFYDRLMVRYEIEEEALSVKVPPMTLQPLVENAMKHGLKDKDAGGLLSIMIKKRKHGVEVCVIDNGEGINKQDIQKIYAQPVSSVKGTGIGLYNVNRRLEKLLGSESKLHIDSRRGEGTKVGFKILTLQEGEKVLHEKDSDNSHR